MTPLAAGADPDPNGSRNDAGRDQSATGTFPLYDSGVGTGV